MPSVSTAQRRAIAIAEHHPDQLYARNRGVLGMTHSQMHDFAAVKEKALPHYAPSSGTMKHIVSGYSAKVKKKKGGY